MKKILVALLSVTMLTPAFWGTSVYASDNLAQITGVSADNGIVSVKTINQADDDIIFTLRVIAEPMSCGTGIQDMH